MFYLHKKIKSSGGYKISDQGAMYFVSFAAVGWVDVFSRKDYKDIVVESLKHCQDKKGLIIYACPKDSVGGVS